MLPGSDLGQPTTSNGHSGHIPVNCNSAVNPGSTTVQTPEQLAMASSRLGCTGPIATGAVRSRNGALLGHPPPGFLLPSRGDSPAGASEPVVNVDGPQGSAADSATVQVTVESKGGAKAGQKGGQAQLPGVQTVVTAQNRGAKRKAASVAEENLSENALSGVSHGGEDDNLFLGEHPQKRHNSGKGVTSVRTSPSKMDEESAQAAKFTGIPGHEQPLVTDQVDKEPRSADGSFTAASGDVKRPFPEVGPT